MLTRVKKYSGIIKAAFLLFMKNDPLKLGGATAFFTMFALPPVITILILLLSIFLNPQTIRKEMFTSLSALFGQETVQQLVIVMQGIRELNSNWLSTILLFVFLLFVATTVFKVVRSAINQLWGVAPVKGARVIAGLKERLISLGVILITGLLFSIGILTQAMEVFAGNIFVKLFPSVSGVLSRGLGYIISVFIIAVWFGIIFKFLNDERPAWRVAWVGGLFTSVLFSIGKAILHVLLTYNNINNLYGASAALVLLLLFVFYAALILYFGAAFTKVWSETKAEELK